ncbi:MAG: hypothetical protein CM1200mP16_06090 [Nitrospina sp.]|nr:MAG: hypothetical protein CM1200mP16_06090 [Nitrospina sp.]
MESITCQEMFLSGSMTGMIQIIIKPQRQSLIQQVLKQAFFLSDTGTYVDRIAVGKKRVIRGGSWYAPVESVTTTHRFWNDPMNNSYGVGLGFRCARSIDNDSLLQARTFYMDALINMGAEKYPQAMKSIEKALSKDASNPEYLKLKEMIGKQVGNNYLSQAKEAGSRTFLLG